MEKLDTWENNTVKVVKLVITSIIMKPQRGAEFKRVVKSTGLRESNFLIYKNPLEDFAVATVLEIGIERSSSILVRLLSYLLPNVLSAQHGSTRFLASLATLCTPACIILMTICQPRRKS